MASRLAELRAKVDMDDMEAGEPEIFGMDAGGAEDKENERYSAEADNVKKALKAADKGIQSIMRSRTRDSTMVRITEFVTNSTDNDVEVLREVKQKHEYASSTLRDVLKPLMDKEDIDDVERRSRENIFDHLNRWMVKSVTEYQRMQARDRERFRASLKHQIQVADMSLPDYRVDTIVDGYLSGDPAFDAEMQATTELSAEVVNAYRQAKERHADIVKLTDDITQLHEMHKQFAFLVAQQSETLNIVEQNVSRAKNHVGKAVKELDKAIKHQKRGRKAIYFIICLLVMVVIGAVVLLIFGAPLTAWGLFG